MVRDPEVELALVMAGASDQNRGQATVIILIVVDEHGKPRDMKVIRPLGLGLDEKALEAIRQWRFNPGKKDGKPVAVQATIEVNFRLL